MSCLLLDFQAQNFIGVIFLILLKLCYLKTIISGLESYNPLTP